MIEIRVGQLADKLGVHRNTVTNWIRGGKLKARATVGKKYLIEKEALLQFCREQGIPDSIMQAVSAFNAVPSLGDARIASIPYSHTNNKREVTMSGKPIGSVLVVGGGIAGIHMVEKSAGIGGVMSQLDKTFPTNDCAM
ncbi:MAG: hypothetical protein H6R26_3127 [Proteobacteria bacterium]|nr:hypothetical protein [Pseudomonadota bacterium]